MQEHQEFDYEEAAEERRQALKSAAEAKEIGRATLETLARQKESLERSEAIAEENIYIMDKSIRVLRGMTWSGWVANIFSKDVEPPEASGKHSKTADASSSFPQMCSERSKYSCIANKSALSFEQSCMHINMMRWSFSFLS
mmetsp:Transcript_2658/g.4137  ORF Transcript_2658/g.4137 Transcript_2658/m.4137 type:complete len:141 (+) Transcript_2658:176-598(+)